MRDLLGWLRSRVVAGPVPPIPATSPGDGFDLGERYTLHSLLGRGGSSLVFLAEQRSMGRKVALKMLQAELVGNEPARRRFLREIRAVSRLKSPHTISVYDVGTSEDGVPYIVMELLRGKSLFQAMCDDPGPMSVDRAVGLVDQALDSLEEAHAAGVLHRDLKPENLFLLAGQAGDEFVKVLDFGIAHVQNDLPGRETEIGLILGTPRYMSPEQTTGKPLDARSDLYSLALILFELLAGHLPFEAPTPVAMAVRKLTQEPPAVRELNPAAKIPMEMEAFLKRALSRNPEDRPASAAEFRTSMLQAMRSAATEADCPAEPVEPPEPVEPAASAEPATRDSRFVPRGPATSRKHPARPAARQGDPDRREAVRARQMVSLRFRHATRECRATSLDISAGGAFLFSRVLPRIGSRIAFECCDPGNPITLLRLSGQVTRVTDDATGPCQVQGFAVRWIVPDGMEPPTTLADLFALHRRLRASEGRTSTQTLPAA